MKKLISVLLCLSLAAPSLAITITVDDDGPADFNNIQAAINDANDGDIVEVRPGIYVGNGNRDIDFLGKVITVRSADPNDPCEVATTIIDCNGSSSEPHQGFLFHSYEDANSILAGLTITNGYVDAGAGVMCSEYSNPTVTNCIFRNNSASQGGGMFNLDSSPKVTNCIFRNNSASTAGGGIGNLGESRPTVTNCIFRNNSAYYSGGGMCTDMGGNPTVNNCTFNRNSATSEEGAGGGIFNGKSSTKLANCILWGNTAAEGPQIYNFGLGTVTVRFSDVQGGWTGMGNIDADPYFADPCSGDYHLKSTAGRWDPNSQTWLIDSVTSPCIDAGNPGCPLGDEPGDANNVRINMGAYGRTAQASKTPSNWRNIADLTNDWSVNFSDLAGFVDYWPDTGQCIPSDLDRSESVEFVDYAILAQQWLVVLSEPAIEYEISPCGMGLLATGQLDGTRFTVTVQDSYIHFEDVMTANCCATQLWLEMDITGNLIKIYEHEAGGYCFCICDYPVTATIGPFASGNYTIEVYEDGGGFIGSTTVYIE